MVESLEQFLEQVARRGSWVGGGSVAACGAALSAALLEKLVVTPSLARQLRAVRQDCLQLIHRDAQTFARVIQATRTKNRHAFVRALKQATEVPARVVEHAHAIQTAARVAKRSINVRFQSDLRCAMAFAIAAGTSAEALIDTNLSWLNDRRYTKKVRRRLRAAARRHGR